MNYIYDILLNFTECGYDFYEWNVEDNIKHIRKIPLLRVKEKDMNSLIKNKIIINDEILNKIKYKTEIFTSKGVKNIKYSILVSDGNMAIAFLINNKGNAIKWSKMLINEEEEILDFAKQMKETTLHYQILEEQSINSFYTRKETEMIKYIKTELTSLINESDEAKLQYLYFECYNKKEKNVELIVKQIKNSLLDSTAIINKAYNFLKLTSLNKK
ncbi:MAG: hypothetical protein PHE54_05015 [Bacilli bacterium]|nr:hypothetical protein [Bacilli bacterium]